MAKYLLLIYGPEEGAMGSTPEEQGALLGEYMAFTKSIIDEGVYRGGEALENTTAATTVRVRNGRTLVSDGPFAETKEVLGGYYLVECDDLDTAIAAAARIPGARDGSIEVRPIAELPPEYTQMQGRSA